MNKTIRIDGKDVEFRATARTPRLYRHIIKRDMIADMNKLARKYKDINDAEVKGISFSAEDLQIFEDAAYVMAWHANPGIEQKTPDEWLDTFDMFSIYEILPQLLVLWGENQMTTSNPKKK